LKFVLCPHLNLINILFFYIKAAGYGYGLISGTFAIVNVLSDMSGPGTIGIFGHSQDFFIATGYLKSYFYFIECFAFF
jgi:hypothetical protein